MRRHAVLATGAFFSLLFVVLPLQATGDEQVAMNDGTQGIEFLTTGASPLYQDWLGYSGNFGCSIDLASLDAPATLSPLRMGIGAIASFASKDKAKVEAYGAYGEMGYQSILHLRGTSTMRLLGGIRLGYARLSFTKSGINLADDPSLYAAARVQADFNLAGLDGFRFGMWYAYEAFIGKDPLYTMPVGITVTYAVPFHFSESRYNPGIFRLSPLVADYDGSVERKAADAVAWKAAAQAEADARVLAVAKAEAETLAAAQEAAEAMAALAVADATAVAEELPLLAMGFANGDSAAQVSRNIELKSLDSGPFALTWASDKAAVIGNDGSFNPPVDDTPVKLTATVSKGSASASRTFAVLAKKPPVIHGVSRVLGTSAIASDIGTVEFDLMDATMLPFGMALDPYTINNDTVLITLDGIPVTGIVGYLANSRSVTFTPAAPFSRGANYNVRMTTGIRYAGGAAIPAGYSFDFTTLNRADIAGQFKFNQDGMDASGKNSDLRISGMGFDTQKVREGTASARFDGKRARATSDMNFGDALTVAVWVNMAAPLKSSLNTILANAVTSESSDGFKLCVNRWNTTDHSLLIEAGNGRTGGKWQSRPGMVLDGNWSHLAFVIDKPNKTIKLYFNGEPTPLTFVSDQGFKEADFAYDFRSDGPFFIGSFLDKDFGYSGNMDDLRIYNVALSDAEIVQIATEK